jgi:hypothetical protein
VQIGHIVLVGFDEEISTSIGKLLPKFLSCHPISSSEFPKKIKSLEPVVIVFNLSARSKFKAKGFSDLITAIKRENKSKPIGIQIFMVANEELSLLDLGYMLEIPPGISTCLVFERKEYLDLAISKEIINALI